MLSSMVHQLMTTTSHLVLSLELHQLICPHLTQVEHLKYFDRLGIKEEYFQVDLQIETVRCLTCPVLRNLRVIG